MNKIIIDGKIVNINYNLVSSGKIFSIAFVSLKIIDNFPIKIIFINQLADKILKEYKINDLVLIEGKLRAKEEMFIIANEIEKLDYKIKRLGNKNGKMVKK